MDIDSTDVGAKRVISIEPSTKPIAGSPSTKINEGVKLKQTSYYQHINLTPQSNDKNHQKSKIS
jgi:hypothetical protein